MSGRRDLPWRALTLSSPRGATDEIWSSGPTSDNIEHLPVELHR
jgi:hypothetical protein